MCISYWNHDLIPIHIYISVKLFGAHQGSDSALMFIQMNRTNRSIATEFVLIEPNLLSVNMPFTDTQLQKKKKISKIEHVSKGDAITLLCPCCSELNVVLWLWAGPIIGI